ncbi:MAG: hypothetical protein IPM37_07835 [Hahellaceae bacterium]|nr:hypothetical protein [Hahellaceae bacterium]
MIEAENGRQAISTGLHRLRRGDPYRLDSDGYADACREWTESIQKIRACMGFLEIPIIAPTAGAMKGARNYHRKAAAAFLSRPVKNRFTTEYSILPELQQYRGSEGTWIIHPKFY